MKICFLNGPNKGKEFPVKNNLILSRDNMEDGDIAIEDPKASNPHAKIVKKKQGFYFKDMDSKNGTYVNKEINDYFILKPGLQFKIGQTVLQVKETPKPEKPWNEIVIEELQNLSIKDQPKKLQVIKPALILTFKSGVQKGSTWNICYGPREAGSASLDLPILEPQAPNICFHLEPSEQSVLFKTQYPDKVLLNKEHIQKKILKDGDCISFAGTFIEISYDK